LSANNAAYVLTKATALTAVRIPRSAVMSRTIPFTVDVTIVAATAVTITVAA
jgi:hypothetical protein